MENSNYLNYYQLYRADKLNAFLGFKKDEELTHTEKELFNARLLTRNKLWDDAILRLENLKTECSFFKAERYFLLASNYLIKSDYEESAKFGNLAVRYYDECGSKEGLFKSFYNLSVAFNRIGMDSLSDFYITQAQKNVESSNQKFIMDRAIVSSLAKKGEFQTAVMMLDSMFNNMDDNYKFEVEQFKIVAVDIYFKAGEISKSKEIIKDVMHAKNTRERGRALFYYHLFNILEEGKKLPEMPESVRVLPEFKIQWELISNIFEGEGQTVSELWNELMMAFPKYYGANFTCIDKGEEKGLFNTVLNKLLKNQPESKVDLSKIRGKKAKKLIECLMNSQTPMRKEDLIEVIWETAYAPSMDARFYKLVERTKSAISIQIKNEHNAYFLAA